MSDIDQRRFDNQHSAFVDARQAAAFLDVKIPTLYSYVSRGLIRSSPDCSGRRRLYAQEDLNRLRARRDARRGHGAVAAGAIRWGEPILDSSITRITPQGPEYRGVLATELANAGHSFESVAELLWTGRLPPGPTTWPEPWIPPTPLAFKRTSLTQRLSLLLPLSALHDKSGDVFHLPQARALMSTMASAMGNRGKSVAETVCRGLSQRSNHDTIQAVNRALILAADHELNVSTFSCRITASAGANLYACVTTGLAALSGPKHGGGCDEVEKLYAACGSPKQMARVLRQRLQRGEILPGFGHPLYPTGDPRGRILLEMAKKIASGASVDFSITAAIQKAMRARKIAGNLDFGLVALAKALRMRQGAAAGIFAIGRAAGWIAHAMEQRRDGYLIRPRARYCPMPGTVFGL